MKGVLTGSCNPVFSGWMVCTVASHQKSLGYDSRLDRAFSCVISLYLHGFPLVFSHSPETSRFRLIGESKARWIMNGWMGHSVLLTPLWSITFSRDSALCHADSMIRSRLHFYNISDSLRQIKASDSFDGRRQQCPADTNPDTWACYPETFGFRLKYLESRAWLLSLTRRRPFRPFFHLSPSDWRVQNSASGGPFSARWFLNRGQIATPLTCERSTGQIMWWFKQSWVRSGIRNSFFFFQCWSTWWVNHGAMVTFKPFASPKKEHWQSQYESFITHSIILFVKASSF